jgi:hypothetical protein
MGTVARTAIVDYHLLFANQEKQTSVSSLHFQQSNESWSFPFSVYSKQTEVAFSLLRIPETWRWRHGGWRHGDLET